MTKEFNQYHFLSLLFSYCKLLFRVFIQYSFIQLFIIQMKIKFLFLIFHDLNYNIKDKEIKLILEIPQIID